MFRAFFKSIALGLLLSSSCLLFGQPIQRRFINFSLEDGLSQSTILDIKQDAIGNTWLATADGVNKFDGNSFEVYKNNPADKNSLSNNLVFAVLPLKDGKVWAISQDKYINEIDPKTKKVKRIAPLKGIDADMYLVKQMLQDAEGNIWLSSYANGVFVLDRSGNIVDEYSEENNKLNSNVVNNLHIDNQYAWVATSNGLTSISLSTKSTQQYFPNRNVGAAYTNKNKLYLSFFDKSAGVYVANKDYPTKLTDSFLRNEIIVSIVQQKSGALWLGSKANGLYEKIEGELHNYRQNAQDRWSLVDNNIWTLYRDVNDDIWIGTTSGLSVFKGAYNIFKLYRNNGSPNSLSSNKIYCIIEDSKNIIWFVTFNGELNSLQNGQFTSYGANNSTGINATYLRTIYETPNGAYYVGSFDRGLFRFYPEQKKFIALQKDENILSEIRKIDQWDKENLIIGYSGGIVIYNTITKTSTPLNIGLNAPYTVFDFYLDGDEIYIATFGSGFLCFNRKTKALKVYKHEDNKKSISSDNIMAIVPIHRDTLALGTYGGGISLFSIANKSFLNFSEADGLANNSVYGILQDAKNNLWLSTNKGIVKWSANRSSFKNYDISTQLQSLEFDEGAFLEAKDGTFYFGGVNGVNFFNPDKIVPNHVSPQAVLTKMQIFDKNFEFSPYINSAKEILLKPTQNNIKFSFKALRYAVPEKTKFYYKLEGLESDWILANNDQTAMYNNLSAGEYVFMVQACNEDDFCDEQPQLVRFTIAAPYYKRPWFIMLVAMLFLGLVFGVYRFRTNNMRKTYLAKMTDSELKALRIQMNPHFIFNSLNSIQYYVLNADSKTAYKYLTKFSSLMRKILQNSKENFLPLEEEIASLKLYLELENMRLEDSLHIQFDIEETIDLHKTLIPTLFLQPFVENAIIHGLMPKEGDKKLKITLKKLNKGFKCEIEDNGIGRDKSKILNEQRSRSHQSTALKAINNRIEIFNTSSKINISMQIVDLFEEEKSVGTKIILIIV